MIRLSLPTFEPSAPLSFRVALRLRQYPDSLAYTVSPIAVELWGGPFAGWVRKNAPEVHIPQMDGLVSIGVDVTFPNPTAVGLTGGEGWFRFVGGPHVLVDDVVVSYTPANSSGRGRVEGHFT